VQDYEGLRSAPYRSLAHSPIPFTNHLSILPAGAKVAAGLKGCVGKFVLVFRKSAQYGRKLGGLFPCLRPSVLNSYLKFICILFLEGFFKAGFFIVFQFISTIFTNICK